MNDFLQNFLIELALLSLLGFLYYLFQKRKIMHYEENKTPLVMGFILQSCLMEKKDMPEPELDTLIESLDDYLQNRIPCPPLSLLKHYMSSESCSLELKDIIREGLNEIESVDSHEK